MRRLGPLIGQATELGMTMGLMAAGLVILGLWLGRWLDARLGTGPWATLLLIVAGAVAGQITIYRLARRSARRLAEEQGALSAPEAFSALRLGLLVLVLLALPGALGLALGLWVDRLLSSGVLATLLLALIGLVVGLAGALRLAYRHARPAPGAPPAEEPASHKNGDQAC